MTEEEKIAIANQPISILKLLFVSTNMLANIRKTVRHRPIQIILHLRRDKSWH